MKRVHTFRGVVIDRPLKAPPKPVAAGPARIRVSRETAGRGGKGVTVVTGLPLRGEALAELAAKLKRCCGAGGSAQEDRIEIQGEHRDRIVAELAKLGFDAKRAGG